MQCGRLHCCTGADCASEGLVFEAMNRKIARYFFVGAICGLCTGIGLIFAGCLSAAMEWQTAAPERQGLDGAKLARLQDDLARRRTKALLVVRHDRIVYEWYAPGHGPEKRHPTASLAKALVGGISLMLALHDGRLAVEDPAWHYIPAWKGDPRKSAITIRHLATHASGLEEAEEDGKPHIKLTGWKGAFWRRDPDPFSIAIHQAPVIFPPGTRYHYSNPGMAVLAYAVTASLHDAPQADIRSLLHERIMTPLGIPESAWSIGYRRAYTVDGLQLYANWGGGSYTARAAARVAQLVLHRGKWQESRLVDPKWIDTMLRDAAMPLPDRRKAPYAPAPGLCWYTNHDGIWPAVPRDAFAGAGAGHQLLLVVPSLQLIAVRNGEALSPGSSDATFWAEAYQHFFEPLMQTLARPPYPPSAVIRNVTFAPEASIVRQAIGSDNWPITWGDDDDLYTAYGDGRGFDPPTDRKLSLGFARITGGPEEFRGTNLRSETGERRGDGKAGAKASGLLMVDGVLYLWVRNVGSSQLVWSEDRGRTWHWGFRFETSFGSPAFLNFGRNYAGARDPYVYFYSQDGPSAYESDDQIVMGRVARDRIRDRDAYELFERLDSHGRPVWTRDIERRGPVFHYPEHCQRVDAVYNPGIGRYLLAVGYNHAGGWGLFDAPEPWGPWTTAFHTEDWGLGGTHGYRLPSKWIRPDGRTVHLIFSGARPYDAFCVRRFDLEIRTADASSPGDSNTRISQKTLDFLPFQR